MTHETGPCVTGAFVVVGSSFVVAGQGHLGDPLFDLSIGPCQEFEGGARGLDCC